MTKLPEDYQTYAVLLEKLNSKYGDSAVIDTSESEIVVVNEDFVLKCVAKVYIDGKLASTGVVTAISPDPDESAKAETKAKRRALTDLPGFYSPDSFFDQSKSEAAAKAESSAETEDTTNTKATFGRKKTKTSTKSRLKKVASKGSSLLNEDDSFASADIDTTKPLTTEEEFYEEGDTDLTPPKKVSRKDILNKFMSK